jgi:hypothetical protein
MIIEIPDSTQSIRPVPFGFERSWYICAFCACVFFVDVRCSDSENADDADCPNALDESRETRIERISERKALMILRNRQITERIISERETERLALQHLKSQGVPTEDASVLLSLDGMTPDECSLLVLRWMRMHGGEISISEKGVQRVTLYHRGDVRHAMYFSDIMDAGRKVGDLLRNQS